MQNEWIPFTTNVENCEDDEDSERDGEEEEEDWGYDLGEGARADVLENKI